MARSYGLSGSRLYREVILAGVVAATVSTRSLIKSNEVPVATPN